jgi:hypothetical protein
VLLVLKLATVPGNAGIQPVYVSNKSFNPFDPRNGAQKLDKDITAEFWSKATGQPDGIPPGDADARFYYYNPNAVDVVVDLIVGYRNPPAGSTTSGGGGGGGTGGSGGGIKPVGAGGSPPGPEQKGPGHGPGPEHKGGMSHG